ncbi:MAG TPA: organic hydroperoxide resistance protein [Jatrophihabitans sp.]|jgi:lipoyl-dependent peroxiredoxin|nr:organic hydroperoxide resistance protein [Jatrophihabitans sp.]
MIALTKVAYTTAASAKGGRAGHVRSADGIIDLDTAQPGTTTEPKANPETLFAAGYAACFQGALLNRGKTKGVDTSESTVTCEVSFGPSEDGGFGLAVELKVSVPGTPKAQVQELIELAHQFCPYSKATRGNIAVTLTALD